MPEKIVSKEDLPGLGETRDLLERLKDTVAGFARREQELNQETRRNAYALRKAHDEAAGVEEGRLAAKVSTAEESFQSRAEQLEMRYESRKEWIVRAHRNARRGLISRISTSEGQRKYALQRQTLDWKRGHESRLAENDQTFRQMTDFLDGEREALGNLHAEAQACLGGGKEFARHFSEATGPAAEVEATLPDDENAQAEEARASIDEAAAALSRFRGSGLSTLFRFLPPWLLALLGTIIPLVSVPLLRDAGHSWAELGLGVGVAAGVLAVVGLLYYALRRKMASSSPLIARALANAQMLIKSSRRVAGARHRSERARIENEFENFNQTVEDEWSSAVEDAKAMRDAGPDLVDEKEKRVSARHEAMHSRLIDRLEAMRKGATGSMEDAADERVAILTEGYETKKAALDHEAEESWNQLVSAWRESVTPLFEEVSASRESVAEAFPAWDAPSWAQWNPPAAFPNAARIASVRVDVPALAGGAPEDERLALPGSSEFSLPILLKLPGDGSVLLESRESGRDLCLDSLNQIVLRLLASAPPGRLGFTILDPVGLGESFAGIMHLADYEEHLIHSRIWTQANQIEERLGELNEHMEKVIQMYLRNEYRTIEEYNEQAGNIAEKYHFLVVADFPSGFSEIAINRLQSIVTAGPRCGVQTLIHWDRRQSVPDESIEDDLKRSSIWIDVNKPAAPAFGGKKQEGVQLVLDSPPDPEFAIEFIHKVGRHSIDSNRVEVPFEHVAPKEEDVWSLDTTSELTVPIGRTGATKLQKLAIGKGTRQHALIAGKTGSGKSTLFHVMITNLALWGSPDEVEFYLVDFKKGVEFKAYATARLPHARVIAIESDREFGLSVLQRVDEELKRRGDLFRGLGAQDIAGFKKAGGTEAIPRCLLIIDEFQEFFVEDDRIAQNAAVLLDRIVRQGRAFGIHVLLGSQTLGGAFTLARATLGQMVIRIALQCNEADAYLIMDDNNPAPRLLTRPGEAIYNDSAGAMEGNSPFQIVWLPDEVREKFLGKVRERASQSETRWPEPIVFEGNAPADVRENPALREILLGDPPAKAPVTARVYLGAPNSIKGPTEAAFNRQGGNNLLIVGQRDEAALALTSVGILSLASQYPKDRARFILLDGSAPDSPAQDLLTRTLSAIPHETVLARGHEAEPVVAELAGEMSRRAEEPDIASLPAVFVCIHGLQKFRKLRFEEDFGFSMSDEEAPASPGAQLDEIVREGAALGIHLVTTVDTYNNVNRFISRKALGGFEMRVLFQMSINDSASLIDSPKAGNLGLHRALFYNEQEGYLETFRPYAVPPADWIEEARRNLARLTGTETPAAPETPDPPIALG